MNKIFDYNYFLYSLNEGIIQFSPPVKQALDDISGTSNNVKDWARKLVLLHQKREEVSSDFNLIDVSNNRGYFSYQPSNKLRDPKIKHQLLHDDYMGRQWYIDNQSGSGLWRGQRPEVKIGTFITKVLKNIGFENPEPTKVEELVQLLNTKLFPIQKDLLQFKIVEGQDIKKYYHQDKIRETKGTLNTSCMRQPERQKYLAIYCQNPSVCSLVILVDNEDKLAGRALLWNVKNKDGEEFKIMDRIYYNTEEIKMQFLKYALENGFWTKKFQNSDEDSSDLFIKPGSGLTSGYFEIPLEGEFSWFPYVDTFFNFIPSKGILTNERSQDLRSNEFEAYEYLSLRKTDGTYHKLCVGIWSDWSKSYIPKFYAKLSKKLGTHVDGRTSGYISDISQETGVAYGYLPKNHPEYVDCLKVVDDKVEIVPSVKGFCGYSTSLGKWIHKGSIIRAIEWMNEYFDDYETTITIATEKNKTILYIPDLINTPGGKVWVKLFERSGNPQKWILKELVDSEGYLLADILMTGKSPIDGRYYTKADSQILKRGVRSFSKKTCRFAYYLEMGAILLNLAREKKINNTAWKIEIEDFMNEFSDLEGGYK